MLGRRIGSWILARELGRGGMGAVFEARHASLQTQAAVKVLSPGLESADSFRQRFRREAELQAQLRHSNVARVLDYVEDGGQWFLVLEYLDRGSLAERLSRGPKPSRQEAIAWTKQALAGLGYAHRKGIVHRDIKPANLMFNEAGEIVVLDFGIARAATSPGLTATGLTIGTPHYMSPEQIETPDRIDGRADIYSLGIVLYEMLAGRKPFEGRSEFSVLQAQVMEPPPPLRSVDPAVPPELEAVVMRALAKKPDERYSDCESMARALDLVERASVVLPAGVPGDATVQHSQLYERVAVPLNALPSPGAQRDGKRRAFHRRLVAGVVTVLAIATFLAKIAGGEKAPPIDPEPGTAPVTHTEGTATDTTTTTTTTTGGSQPVKPDREKVNHFNAVVKPPVVTITAPTETAPPPPIRPQLPPLPATPQIAVVGLGSDPVFAAALEQEVERRLRETHRVSDEHGDPDVSDLLRRADVKANALGAQLLKGGFHVLVLARVEEGDRKTITFRGETGSMKASRIRLNAYLLPANRTIGSGWTELVEYNELSLDTKAKMAFIGATADLRQTIDDEWAQLRAAHAGGAR